MNETNAYVQDYIRRRTEYYTQLEPINELNTMNQQIHLNKDNIEAQVRAHRFIVASLSDVGISMSASPVVHSNMATARAECARLAKLHPGKNFLALQLAGLERVAYQPNVSI